MDNDNALSGTANYTLTNLADGLHNITINCSDSTLSTIKTLNISIDHTLLTTALLHQHNRASKQLIPQLRLSKLQGKL